MLAQRQASLATIWRTDADDDTATRVEPLAARVLNERHVEEVERLRLRRRDALVEEHRHADS